MGILDFTVFQDGMVLVTNFTQVRIHPPIGQKYLFGRVFTLTLPYGKSPKAPEI